VFSLFSQFIREEFPSVRKNTTKLQQKAKERAAEILLEAFPNP